MVAALGELKGLEETRRKQEVEAAQRAIDAQIAREREAAAERARVVAETERRIADEARQVSMRAEAETRAQRLVAIEAEARAKAQAEIAVQASLAAERQAQELALKRELALRKKPRALIALCGVLTLAVIALIAIIVQRGIALDDARQDAHVTDVELAGMKTRVAKLEADLDNARAQIVVLQGNQVPAPKPVVTPPPAATTRPHPHGRPHGGGDQTTDDDDTIDTSDKCVNEPLGCPTKDKHKGK